MTGFYQTRTAKQSRADKLITELLKHGLISPEDAKFVVAARADHAGEQVGRFPSRTRWKRRLHLRNFLGSSRLVGLSSFNMLKRMRALQREGMSHLDATHVGLSLPWISDLRLDDAHRDVLAVLREYDIDVAEVMQHQPATVHIPASDVRERIEAIITAGFSRIDTAKIM